MVDLGGRIACREYSMQHHDRVQYVLRAFMGPMRARSVISLYFFVHSSPRIYKVGVSSSIHNRDSVLASFVLFFDDILLTMTLTMPTPLQRVAFQRKSFLGRGRRFPVAMPSSAAYVVQQA